MAVIVLLLAALLAQAQDAGESAYRQGLLLLKQNDTPGALSALEKAAGALPGEPMVWMALAEARLRAKDLAGATKAAESAAKLAPADPVVKQVRAMFHSRASTQAPTPPMQAQHWKAAVQLDPARVNYRIGYGRFLLDKRAEKEAEAELRTALSIFPQNPELHRLLALALYAQGRNTEAIGSFLQAIDLAPGEDALYASLETLLPPPPEQMAAVRQRIDRYRREDPERPLGPYLAALCGAPDAEALLRQAIAADPEFWPAYFELHKYPEKRGETAEVVKLLEKVVQLQPEFAPAHYRLAQAYAQAGDRAAARRERSIHHRLTHPAP